VQREKMININGFIMILSIPIMLYCSILEFNADGNCEYQVIQVASGVYLYKLTTSTGDYLTKKMILMK
jgi:hypothetical protein